MFLKFKEYIQKMVRKRFNQKQYCQFRQIYRTVFSFVYQRDLTMLALIHGSDKAGYHQYTKHYQTFFQGLRNKKLNILEIGIGGDNNHRMGGASLRMWKSYFPKAMIYGIDIFDKKFLDCKRIKTFRGDQTDEKFLISLVQETGGFDIIIDDGSHINEHIIQSFKILFPTLKIGGMYVIEDLLSSYDPRYGGDHENLDSPKTAVNFLKSFVDNINIQNIIDPISKLRFYSKDMVALHFFHNLTMIQKGESNGINFSMHVRDCIENEKSPWIWVKDEDVYKMSP